MVTSGFPEVETAFWGAADYPQIDDWPLRAQSFAAASPPISYGNGVEDL